MKNVFKTLTFDATVQRVTYYLYRGVWCYAAWTSEGFDRCGDLDLDDTATWQDAAFAARAMFPGAEVQCVEAVS